MTFRTIYNALGIQELYTTAVEGIEPDHNTGCDMSIQI